jgi:hypothetical protein
MREQQESAALLKQNEEDKNENEIGERRLAALRECRVSVLQKSTVPCTSDVNRVSCRELHQRPAAAHRQRQPQPQGHHHHERRQQDGLRREPHQTALDPLRRHPSPPDRRERRERQRQRPKRPPPAEAREHSQRPHAEAGQPEHPPQPLRREQAEQDRRHDRPHLQSQRRPGQVQVESRRDQEPHRGVAPEARGEEVGERAQVGGAGGQPGQTVEPLRHGLHRPGERRRGGCVGAGGGLQRHPAAAASAQRERSAAASATVGEGARSSGLRGDRPQVVQTVRDQDPHQEEQEDGQALLEGGAGRSGVRPQAQDGIHLGRAQARHRRHPKAGTPVRVEGQRSDHEGKTVGGGGPVQFFQSFLWWKHFYDFEASFNIIRFFFVFFGDPHLAWPQEVSHSVGWW